MKQRITYIDGIRGFACMMVFVNHFLMAFFPASYLGADAVSHSSKKIDLWYSQSALSALTNGNFWVCVFFIVSAFVISVKIMNVTLNEPHKLSSAVSGSLIKRYPRLCLPVFVVCILIFLCQKFGFFYNNIAAAITGSSLMTGRYASPLSLTDLFTCGFIKIWFLSDETFSNSFWMLSTLFFGGFLSSILSLMVQKKNQLILLVYLFFGLICLALSSLYLTFIIGTALAYLYVFHADLLEHLKNNRLFQLAAWVFFIIGLFLGGYPSGVTPSNYYALMNHLPGSMMAYQLYHMLGAACLIASLLCLLHAQKFFSIKPILFLGKISFAVYLFNLPLIFSLSSGLLIWIYQKQLPVNYSICSAAIFVITSIILIVISWLFNRYVETFCNKMIAKFLSLIALA